MPSPAYVLVDPLGTYAARLKAFLDQLGLPAITVFSNRARLGAWDRKWRDILGENVVAELLADESTDLDALAAEIEREWPQGLYGIVPWDEMHIVLGAELSDRLELGWNPRRVIERCRDKWLMKDWLRRHGGVRINASRVVATAAEALAFQEEVGAWPIVVKPTGGAGAISVFFADDRAELLHHCQAVLESGLGEVLVEEYVGGQEFAVNGMVDRDHDFLITDVWIYDKRASHGIPNLYYQSIKLSSEEPIFWELARYAADVVAALGLRRSPVHMEVKVDERGPCLIEVGARMAGGDQPVLASKVHGRSLFDLAACHYLDELPLSPTDVDFGRYDSLAARIVSGIQSRPLERIRTVRGVAEVESLPSFEGFGALRMPGMSLPQTRDLETKSYEVYLLHPDPRQVALDAERIRHLLRYE